MESAEEKIEKAKEILQGWLDKQSHERCWYYPDLFKKLIEVFEIKMEKEPSLPPLQEFKRHEVDFPIQLF